MSRLLRSLLPGATAALPPSETPRSDCHTAASCEKKETKAHSLQKRKSRPNPKAGKCEQSSNGACKARPAPRLHHTPFFYIYTYMVAPPKKIYVFYLFSAISTHEHLVMTITAQNPSFHSRVSDHLVMTAQTDHIETQCGQILQ